jgi:hypothetical protein
MDKRTTGIVLTVAAVLLCGCPGICVCLYGGLSAAGVGTFDAAAGDFTSTGEVPVWVGIVMLCVGILMIAVPVVVGVVTLRNKPEGSEPVPNIEEPLPPPS